MMLQVLRLSSGDLKPKRIYTDQAVELIKACRQLTYNHDTSTPYRHQSNAHAERIVKKVVEGARTILEQAGLPSCFWIFAVRHWCFMDNTEIKNGESAWALRHKKGHFTKPRISVLSLRFFRSRTPCVPCPSSRAKAMKASWLVIGCITAASGQVIILCSHCHISMVTITIVHATCRR